MRVLITGANGHLGRRLITALSPRHRITALVRSAAAAQQLHASADGNRVDVVVVDYTDDAAVTAAAHDCDRAVHLVGILRETANSQYAAAHEGSSVALIAAAREQQLEQIIYVSILGATAASPNACLASKGRAEEVLVDSAIPALILRVPMVMGEGDHAARALRRRVRARAAVLLRGASREQPIYAGDVVDAIVAQLECATPLAGAFDLAGPESLSHVDLVRRAARCCGCDTPVFVSIPIGPALAAATCVEWLAGRLGRTPGVTRAMLEVLDHDDQIDSSGAAATLGIELTSLDEMLRCCLIDAR